MLTATVTMTLAAMAIWASDFIASDVTDCTPDVKYSINRVGEPNRLKIKLESL